MEYCEKHGPYSVLCRYCDIDAMVEEEHRLEAEREEREAQEQLAMEEHFRKHPHG